MNRVFSNYYYYRFYHFYLFKIRLKSNCAVFINEHKYYIICYHIILYIFIFKIFISEFKKLLILLIKKNIKS